MRPVVNRIAEVRVGRISSVRVSRAFEDFEGVAVADEDSISSVAAGETAGAELTREESGEAGE